MRITDLSLAGQGAWPELQLEALKPQLNVLFGQPRTGKSTVAQLVSHLLYGKPASAWRQQFGQTIPRTEGLLTVKSSGRSFVLRRHLDTGSCHTGSWHTGSWHTGSWQTENCDSGNDATGRLTIAATDDAPVDGQTVRAFLSGLSPEMAMHLFAVDFAEPPRIEWLLSETFAQEFIHRQQLTELDTEITVCRKTLGDLQSREKAVRTDLAQISPDGTADSVKCLADGRMTLVAMEQLLNDLDAEVAHRPRVPRPDGARD